MSSTNASGTASSGTDSSGTDSSAPFPGNVGTSWLRVYDWPTDDDEHGGSSHVHLVSTEGYVVLGGTGRLQTLGPDGYVELPLQPRDIVWFTPGVIHRSINDGDLEILVVMQNAGLPEAGDAVLTFPPEVLADPERYAAAASLARSDRIYASDEQAAQRRRDLAIEGFCTLRDGVLREGPDALTDFYRAAARLVKPKLADWEKLWRDGPLAAAERTGEHLRALAAGEVSQLSTGGVFSHRPEGPEKFGMCGRLTTYDADGARRGTSTG